MRYTPFIVHTATVATLLVFILKQLQTKHVCPCISMHLLVGQCGLKNTSVKQR